MWKRKAGALTGLAIDKSPSQTLDLVPQLASLGKELRCRLQDVREAALAISQMWAFLAPLLPMQTVVQKPAASPHLRAQPKPHITWMETELPESLANPYSPSCPFVPIRFLRQHTPILCSACHNQKMGVGTTDAA